MDINLYYEYMPVAGWQSIWEFLTYFIILITLPWWSEWLERWEQYERRRERKKRRE